MTNGIGGHPRPEQAKGSEAQPQKQPKHENAGEAVKDRQAADKADTTTPGK